MTHLPVTQTVLDAYIYLWQERQYLWQLTLPPLVILGILGALVQWGTISSIETMNGASYVIINRSGWTTFLFLVMLFTNIWAWLSYSVAWHRSYLVRGEGKNILKAYTWNGRQLKFFFTSIKIFLLVLPALLIFPFLVILQTPGILLLIPGVIIFGYINARLLLWFPAVSVDQNLDIKSLWRLSDENGWRLLIIVVCISLPLITVSLTAVFLTGPLGSFTHPPQSLSLTLLRNLIFEFLSFMGLAASISALSISYKFLMERKNF